MSPLVIFVFIVAYVRFADCVLCDKTPKNAEGKLKKDIFCGNYDPSIRPVSNLKNATNVKVKMVVKSYEFKDSGSLITINSWLLTSWKDEFLKWEPETYEGVESIEVRMDEIWAPQLALYSADIGRSIAPCSPSSCIVQYLGQVICFPPCSHVGHCNADYKNWPYDRHTCELIFGTWVNTGEEIDFHEAKTSVYRQDVVVHKEWQLISANVTKHIGNYSCCDTFPSLKFKFIIERHSGTHSALLIVPISVILLLHFLNLLMDVQSTERIICLVISFFAQLLFINQIFWIIPFNGDIIPSIVIFIRDSLILSATLIVFTVLLANWMPQPFARPPMLDRLIDRLADYSLTRAIFFSYIGRKKCVDDPENADDSTQILGDVVTDNKYTIQANNQKMRSSAEERFVRFVDRLVCIIILMLYLLMILTLVPLYYSTSPNVSAPKVNDIVL